jgi:hypothetical protein
MPALLGTLQFRQASVIARERKNMSEETQSNNQQMIVIALVVIAVLLAAIVGVVIWQQSKAASTLPNPTATGSTAPAATPPAGMGGATGGSAAAPAAAAGPFDAKTATKVTAGKTPEQFLQAYGDAILAGKFAEAYKMLPLDKQQSYGDAAAYESQVKAYGITKFNMGKATTSGDTVSIVSEQVTPQMPITYTWAFKKVGGQWYVESRTMGGSLQ